jgi:flavorubredoxin
MMKCFFGTDFAERRLIVKEGDTLSTGRHTFTFVAAPMVHWPEVIVTYDTTDKILFSADGFGKFGANDVEDPEGWDCEARRYYIGIVGKYGPQTQALLKKAAALEIRMICPLHGPVLSTPEEIAHAVEQYATWSSYAVETPGVLIAYTSVYGHTKAAALKLKDLLLAKGCPKVALADLARDDQPEAVEDAFRYGALVLATTTYNGGIFPWMRHFIDHLTERNYQKRTVAFIENGLWAPAAAKTMRQMLDGARDLTFCETVVSIRGALSDDSNAQLDALADELVK